MKRDKDVARVLKVKVKQDWGWILVVEKISCMYEGLDSKKESCRDSQFLESPPVELQCLASGLGSSLHGEK